MVLETHYYDMLSVSPSATTEEISKAYKKTALKCHPDKTNHDPKLTEQFKQLTQIYEVLRDDGSRKIYDKYGKAGLDGQLNSQPTTTRPNNFQFRSARDVFSQVFSEFNTMNQQFDDFNGFPFGNMGFNSMPFGNMNNMNMNGEMKRTVRPAPGQRSDKLFRGKNIFHTCKLTLDELAHGKTVKLQLPRRTKCDVCNGDGGFDKTSCRVCQGNGRVVITMSNQFSKFQEIGSCKDCSGTGSVVSSVCNNCEDGYHIVDKILELTVLPGTKCGEEIIIKQAGDEGRNIIPGDVIIKIKQRPHDYLVRKSNDLYTEANIDLKTALLGGYITLRDFLKQGEDLRIFINVHGKPELNEHESIQHGEILGTINPGSPKIVSGFGMPINNNAIDGIYYQSPDSKIHTIDNYKRGDLFIKLNVQLPNVEDFKNGFDDLSVLTRILPDKEEPSEDQRTIVDSHLSNLPFTSAFNKKEGSFSSTSSNEQDSKRPRFS
ncbi:j domain-containing protein Apj1p [[Candida] jaroonii]|uniref:J domain-containing protein Apj1p n=1 Tax=[Candida] jaroonii TaxID=467808 RepID=A0ACA9Y9Y9_9ASCO|nr:j domain-containing protein Apj1p [[Candida] jaroonii]